VIAMALVAIRGVHRPTRHLLTTRCQAMASSAFDFTMHNSLNDGPLSPPRSHSLTIFGFL